jgi:hypothetical protein
MDISVLGPVVRPERIELAELAEREWRCHVKEASDEQLVDQITREIGELADHGDERRGLRSRGWEVFTDNWRHKSAQLVAVCTTGTLVGTAVYADSWEDNVSERLALAKVLELEKQASSTPQEVPTATFWNRLITSIARIVQSEKER